MGVCLHVCLFPWRSEDSMESPGTEVTDDCEPPYGFCEPNSGPVEEQLVLLTTEPSLWPLCEFFLVLYVCICYLLGYVFMCVCVCICVYRCVCVYTGVCVQVCMCVYRCVCICVYLCIQVCIQSHADQRLTSGAFPCCCQPCFLRESTYMHA